MNHNELEMTPEIEQRWIEDVTLFMADDAVAFPLAASILRLKTTPAMRRAGIHFLTHRNVAIREVALEALEHFPLEDSEWADLILGECRRMALVDGSAMIRSKAAGIVKRLERQQ